MQYWKVKISKYSGTTYQELYHKAKNTFALLRKNPKRKLYVRSKYFKKQKVFFDYYWDHLLEKPISQRKLRLKFLPCAIELLESTCYQPTIKLDPNKKSDLLLRFYGETKSDEKFVVQIKQSKKSLQCISIFPCKK